MKIVRFGTEASRTDTSHGRDEEFPGRVGVSTAGGIVDVTDAAGGSLRALIADGPTALQRIHQALANAPVVPGAKLLAPVVSHPRIFGIGLNYAEHTAESKLKAGNVPTVFLKLASSIVGPGDPIVLPDRKISKEPDYEGELALVIGQGGYRIAAADWERHVFGYTICNDVSARDVQFATSQWSLAKSFPTFCPIGPWIVTPDELGDPHQLDLATHIVSPGKDGEQMQHSNTRHLIFGIPQLIEYVSSIVPLVPGDVLSTGTPAGVGMGREPRRWLRPGEEVVITIHGIGELRNPVRAEV